MTSGNDDGRGDRILKRGLPYREFRAHSIDHRLYVRLQSELLHAYDEGLNGTDFPPEKQLRNL